jgi:DNA-binding response OmpR family regulator
MSILSNETENDSITGQLTILHHNGMCLIVELSRFEILGREVHLTKTEFLIMHCLMNSPEIYVSRSELMDWIESRSNVVVGYDRNIDIHIKRIRRKLLPRNPTLAKQLLCSRYKVGYALHNFRT